MQLLVAPLFTVRIFHQTIAILLEYHFEKFVKFAFTKSVDQIPFYFNLEWIQYLMLDLVGDLFVSVFLSHVFEDWKSSSEMFRTPVQKDELLNTGI